MPKTSFIEALLLREIASDGAIVVHDHWPIHPPVITIGEIVIRSGAVNELFDKLWRLKLLDYLDQSDSSEPHKCIYFINEFGLDELHQYNIPPKMLTKAEESVREKLRRYGK